MTILINELKKSKLSFIIWTLAIAFFMALCVFLYPSMKEQMAEISESFASMGTFSEAFGLDKVSFGTLSGYYGIECGNVLGLGGAFYAALISIGVLANEEKEHTVEFLITHPVKRTRITLEKLLSCVIMVIALNIVVILFSLLSFAIIGEMPNGKEFFLLHLAYTLMQIEIVGICFGISSLLNGNGLGIGLGLATVFYFLNIVANLMDSLTFIKYFTPFGYCDGANIISEGKIDLPYVISGFLISAVFVFLGFYYYNKKDMKS